MRYEVRCASGGWMQRGELTVAAPHGRAVRLLAMEEIRRRCGRLPHRITIGNPR